MVNGGLISLEILAILENLEILVVLENVVLENPVI